MEPYRNGRSLAKDILSKRKSHSCSLSLKSEAKKYANEMLQFLFPHFSEHNYYTEVEIEAKRKLLKRNLKNILNSMKVDMPLTPDTIAGRLDEKLPEIYDKLWLDAQAIYDGDPAAESIDEVILAYPGFLTIFIYRIAHELYLLKVPIFPRILTEYAHEVTGIDIHPGATIGKSFCIDHGTGIVIGETSDIGNNVKLYQGVTLGALSVDKDMAKTKRHPTIEDNVVIYAQAVILGGDTTIGHDSVIGGNAWLTSSVQPNSVVYHKSEVRYKTKEEASQPFDFVI
jgi:serine O-acetyltransferase